MIDLYTLPKPAIIQPGEPWQRRTNRELVARGVPLAKRQAIIRALAEVLVSSTREKILRPTFRDLERYADVSLAALLPGFGAGAVAADSGELAEPTLEFIDYFYNPAALTTYEHTVDLGAWSSDLDIIVAAHFDTSRTLVAGSVQGQPAQVHVTAQNGRGVGIMSAKPQAGGSQTISVTASGGSTFNTIGVWRRRYGAGFWPYHTHSHVSSTDGTRTVTLSVPGDLGVALAASSSSSVTEGVVTNATARYNYTPKASNRQVGGDYTNEGSLESRSISMRGRALVGVTWPGSVPLPPLDGLSPTLAISSSRKLLSSYSGMLFTDAGGGSISAVLDQSGAARNLTQTTSANRPTLSTGGPKGRACFQFDGVNDQLLGPVIIPDIFAAGNKYMCISLIPESSGAVVGTSRMNVHLTPSETLYINNFDTGGFDNIETAIPGGFGVPLVVEYLHLSGVLSLRINGVTTLAVASGNTDTIYPNFRLGTGGFKLFDLVAFNVAPSAVDQRRIAGKFYEWIASSPY